MKSTKNHDNYVNNYNLFQLALPLNIEVVVELDEGVKLFVKLMRKVNVGQYLKPTKNIGRYLGHGEDGNMVREVYMYLYPEKEDSIMNKMLDNI